MRIRIYLAVALLAGTAVPALRAQPEGDAKKAAQPAIVLKVKSLDGVMSDAKYLAKLAGQEEVFKQAEEALKAFGGESGLGGIDTKRPFALYGDITPGVQDSPVVFLLPIADEKAFVNTLESLNVKAEKDKDGVYTIDNIPGAPIPVTVYFRFANKYAYVTAMEKGNIAEKKLLKPETLVPAAGDTSLASLNLRVDALPDIFKQIALGQIDNQLAAAKEQAQPNESEAMKKLRIAMIDMVSEKLKSLLTDGEEVTVKLGVDQQKEDLSAEFTFKAKKGSQLAKDMASVGKASSLFANLSTDNAAVRVISAIALPAELRKLMGPAVDEAIKEAIAKETDPEKVKVMKMVFDAVVPTLKAGELDAGVTMVGPNKDGQYTIVGGAKVIKGKGIEDAVRELAKMIPEKDRQNLILDATSEGDVKIHKIVVPDADADTKKLFGEMTAYVAIRDDAVLFAAGPDALKALKDAVAAQAKPSTTLLKFDVSMGRIGGLNPKDPKAADLFKEVFGKDPKNDKVTITVEMGDTLKVSLNANAKLVTLGAKSQQK